MSVSAATHDLAGLMAACGRWRRAGALAPERRRALEHRYTRANRLREEADLTADRLGLPSGMAPTADGRTLCWPGRNGRGLVVREAGHGIVRITLTDGRGVAGVVGIDRNHTPWATERAGLERLMRDWLPGRMSGA